MFTCGLNCLVQILTESCRNMLSSLLKRHEDFSKGIMIHLTIVQSSTYLENVSLHNVTLAEKC